MRLPSYRRHSSGQARITLNGKDFLLGEFNSKESRRQYNKILAEYISGGKSSSFGVAPSELTILELLASYRKYLKKYHGSGPESELHRFEPVFKALKSLYAPEVAIGFGPKEYKATRAHLSLPQVRTLKDKTKVTRTRSRTYVNSLMKRVRRIFRWASSEGLLPASVFQALKTVDPIKLGRTDLPELEAVKPIDSATIEATIAHLPKVVADMVKFQLLTGARPGEVCSVTPGMIDRTNEVWEIHFSRHKTAWRGKSRTVYVGPQAQLILMPYLLRASDAYCFSPIEADRQRREARHAARTTPLSCGNRPGTHVAKKPLRTPGERYATRSYGRAVSYAAKRAGLPVWGPNRLRHSLATNIRQAEGLEAAAVILGHSEVGVTQVYAEADRVKAIEVVRRLG